MSYSFKDMDTLIYNGCEYQIIQYLGNDEYQVYDHYGYIQVITTN